MMTVAPSLSACLMIIVSSLAKDVIVFCSEIEIFLLTFDFSLGSRGIFVVLAIKLSKISSLPCGGTKFDLFRTRDSSSSSHPSKNSTRRTLRVKSDISFDNSCMFEFRGVGVNFSPFSSNLISVLFNFLCDKLTICVSGFVVVMDFCMASVLGIKKDSD